MFCVVAKPDDVVDKQEDIGIVFRFELAPPQRLIHHMGMTKILS